MSVPYLGLIIRLFGLLLLGAGIWFAHQQTVVIREQRSEALAALEQKPVRDADIERQMKTLADRSFDIGRIEGLLVDREALITVVSAMEREAERHTVSIEVPDIEEVEYEKDRKLPAAVASGSQQDIALTVLVEGSPEDVIAFVHSVEHLPYLLRLSSMFVLTKEVDELSEEGEVVQTGLIGQGTTEFILTIRSDSNSKSDE